jgi:hypothetical protein
MNTPQDQIKKPGLQATGSSNGGSSNDQKHAGIAVRVNAPSVPGFQIFGGSKSLRGNVVRLKPRSFGEFVASLPVQTISITRAEFHRLTKKERDQHKRVDYIVAATFKQSRSNRATEHAVSCHVIFLDIDDPVEADRLLKIGFAAPLGDTAAVVWHTANSTPAKPRLRVMVRADGIPLSQYPAAVIALGSKLGLTAVTPESKVAVQPMYLPSRFAGEPSPTLVYSNPSGRAFVANTHTTTATHATKLTPPPSVVGVADITHLAPLPDPTFSSADLDELLEHLDPDVSRADWIKIGAGIKHQFGDAGYAQFDAWSRRSATKYNFEDTRKTWDSLQREAKGRRSVTIGTLIQMGQANGYVRRKPIPISTDSMIVLPGCDVSISAAAQTIFPLIAARKELFYRGGMVHEIVEDRGTDGHKLSPVSATQFRSRLEKYGRIFVWRKGAKGEPVLKPTICPEETAKALLACEHAGRYLPNITLLSRCPIFVEDSIVGHILGPGWHPENGGTYITGGATPPVVPLADAVRDLRGLLADFDFATPGDHSRALASLIGPALKFGGWLSGSLPIDMAEADQSQAGKGYRHKCVAAIYREVPNIVAKKTGGVGGLDESISQRLVDGRPFVMLDNLRGKLDSQYLEALLTAPGPVGARVPHRGEVSVDPRNFVFQITSNGVETTKDLANRASIIRIRKQPPAYVFKNYPEGDVYNHIKSRQPHYLGCVFAVIKEWVKQAEPSTTELRHDNREWAQKMDWIVQTIFSGAPLLDGFTAAQQRVSDQGRSWFRAVAIAAKASGSPGPFIASQIAKISYNAGLTIPGCNSADPEDQARAVGKVMASAFGTKSDGEGEIEIEGGKIRRVRDKHPECSNPGNNYWFE